MSELLKRALLWAIFESFFFPAEFKLEVDKNGPDQMLTTLSLCLFGRHSKASGNIKRQVHFPYGKRTRITINDDTLFVCNSTSLFQGNRNIDNERGYFCSELIYFHTILSYANPISLPHSHPKNSN